MAQKKVIMLSVGRLDDAFQKMRDSLAPHAEVRVVGLSDYSLSGVDIFIGKRLSESALTGADRLKAVFAYKTGVDEFPMPALLSRGIELFNSHANSRAIAQYAFALGTALAARIVDHDRKMRVGDWDSDDPYWSSIFSMRAGLVGYGHIGRELFKLLSANGIECFTLDRGKRYDGLTAVHTVEELADRTDMLFLSLPDTDETDGMFGEALLSRMRGKYIVNVGRSNCIDEAALYDALKTGTLAGAAIDTWRQKPKAAELLIPFDQPFNELDNLILSSHKAMMLSDGHDRYVDDVLGMVLCYLSGGVPKNKVDLKAGY